MYHQEISVGNLNLSLEAWKKKDIRRTKGHTREMKVLAPGPLPDFVPAAFYDASDL